jgi:hypothetical protein
VDALADSTGRAGEDDRAGWFHAHDLTVRWYYGGLTVVLLYTLVAQCFLTHHQGRSLANTFSYFTIQSNVLVLVTSAVLCARPEVSGALWRVVRLAALCGITVTGIVYTTVLAPYVHLSGWGLAYDYVFHYLVPAASVIGFVFVGPRLRFRGGDFVYMAWPVLWLVYTMVRADVTRPKFRGFGEATSRYPYRFLDIDRVSTSEVVGSIVLVAALLVGCGFAYLYGERRLEANVERRTQAGSST